MRKIAIGILAVCFLVLGIFIGMEIEPNADELLLQKMKQNCRDVMPSVSLVEDNSEADLKYRGVVPNWDPIYAGLARLTDGSFNYYCDSVSGELRKIERRTDQDTRISRITEKQAGDAAEQLCVGVLGKDILSLCEREVIKSSDEISYTMEYVYPNGDSENLAASITYLREKGVLLCAFFQDTEALVKGENLVSSGEITREEALAAAKEEAVSFIAKKYPDNFSSYVLEEESIEYQKVYSPVEKRVVWNVEMYYWEDGNEYPFYFGIDVDIYTGQVIMNANNYT